MTFTPERERVALERFSRFFAELRSGFVERDDVLKQLALALLAREHVLMTGPPGTGKSLLTSSLLGRIVCENTGEPSLFSRQLTESTVQTDLIGSVDFRTLTDTGRTEYFTDEGMLGAVHAFLDEVLDGRDMLLRATLNLLEERELKQGTKVTRGQIECAVMTTNRYLSEALEEGRGTLLAFVDRIAFVSFVPRGFARREHLEQVVESALSGGMNLSERLTIQDLDVLQEMVERVRIPAAVSSALVDISRRFDAKTHELERADPTFARTRYLSTRAVIRLGRILRAVVVFDRATAQPERALVAQGEDLGPLRLGLMLAGTPLADIDALLAQESEPRERRQLHIMKAEAQVFQDVMRETPPIEAEPEEATALAPAPEPEPVSTRELRVQREWVARVRAMLNAPGELSSIRQAYDATVAYEREQPNVREATVSMRGHLLATLAQSVAFARGDSPDEVLGFLEEAVTLRELIVAMDAPAASVDDVDAAFDAAILALGQRYEVQFDVRVASEMKQLLSGPVQIIELLGSLRPLLTTLQDEEERYLALRSSRSSLSARAPEDPPSFRVVKRRVVGMLRAAYQRVEGVERGEIHKTLERVMIALEGMKLAAVVPVDEHLRWVASSLVPAKSDVTTLPATLDGYRALREEAGRTPMSVALAEVLTTLQAFDESEEGPGLERMAASIAALPESLRDELAGVDLTRIERAVDLLERWGKAGPAEEVREICFEERALLRFCLECEVLQALFPHAAGPAVALAARLNTLGASLRDAQSEEEQARVEEEWSNLPGAK
ncbi:MAG: AAA family ATPase [Polyangiales bacterium]